MTETPPLAAEGRVEIRGQLEFRDAEGKVVGTTDFVWKPPVEVPQALPEEADE